MARKHLVESMNTNTDNRPDYLMKVMNETMDREATTTYINGQRQALSNSQYPIIEKLDV